jgi:hypothetical protein
MKKTGGRMVAAAVVWSGLSSMPARAKGLAQTITLRAALKKFGLGLALAGVGLAPGARADTVTDWNANLERAIVATAPLGKGASPPPSGECRITGCRDRHGHPGSCA